jgi:hypothetical protein
MLSAQSKGNRPAEAPPLARDKRRPNLLRCACADRLRRPSLHSGQRTLLLHLPPPVAWARAKACLKANTAENKRGKGAGKHQVDGAEKRLRPGFKSAQRAFYVSHGCE